MAKTFGISVANQLVWGVVQSVDTNETAEVAEARDVDGKVTDQVAYSKTVDKSFEFVLNGAAPGIGTVVTIDSVDYLMTSKNVKEENTNFSTGSMTVQLKDAATITAYA